MQRWSVGLTSAMQRWSVGLPYFPVVSPSQPACSADDIAWVTLLTGVLIGACTLACWQCWHKRSEDFCDVELVALFCNPQGSRSSGLQPLAFGQDLKFLMRTLPHGSLYVEPAASLYTMRRALVHHRPRFLVFSGHTASGGHLCFETPNGTLDRAADTTMLVGLLRTLSRSHDAAPSTVAAVEAHLDAQQAAAFDMQHCSRAWMERAASERAATTALDDHPPSPSQAISRITGHRTSSTSEPVHALSRLQCIVLNACESLEVGRALVRALPGVAVVCWPTLAEDAAARAFMVGFMARLASACALERPSLIPWAPRLEGLPLVKAAFQAGCNSFSRGGFRFGDPNDFLHPRHHPHWRKPDFKTCRHCAPPVQGKVVLLYEAADGSGLVEELHGRDAMRNDERSWQGRHLPTISPPSPRHLPTCMHLTNNERSWQRQWRALVTGTRIAERTTWEQTNEVVRDLHKAYLKPQTPTLRRHNSAAAAEPVQLLYPEVGVASQFAQPGALRRAHVLDTAAAEAAGGTGASSRADGEAQANRLYAGQPLPIGLPALPTSDRSSRSSARESRSSRGS